MLYFKLFSYAIKSIFLNFFSRKKVFLISEASDWVINEECKNIKNYSFDNKSRGAVITYFTLGIRKKIIHFMSENTLIGRDGIKNRTMLQKIDPSNKIVFTWFHISNMDEFRIKFIPLLNETTNFVHTACNTTKKKLLLNGLREEKIVVIPLGVNLDIFKPITEDEKTKLRKKLGLPADKIIIGSFQKDGIGWNEGLEPKLIKGPDIFCNVVEKLSKNHNIHVMITGPARGYVRRRLEKAGIPYSYAYLKKYYDVSKYYQVLDLYLICSREEGGPKALLESMASGIPLVSTKVGMVSDIVEDGKDGFTVNIENEDELFKKSELLINDAALRKLLIKNSLEKIKKYEIKKISKEYYNKIYSKLI